MSDPEIIGGRYRLVERVAQGGMGEVWRAEDQVLRRPVAVKQLLAEFAGDPAFRVRFEREARLSAGLGHSGVAHVYDFGDGSHEKGPDQRPARPYIVMEFVEGESLATILAREHTLSPDRTLDIVAQAADALGAAHANGLVHRDVKPGNLMIRPDGVVKVTDFGIARALDAAPITRQGATVGTPLYLSPEQAAGHAATPSSDIYGLGVIAFHCLTGAPPYEGPAAAVTMAHRDSPMPPLPPAIPGPVRDLVATMTAKNPRQRPRDAAAVVTWARRLRGEPEPAATLISAPATPLPPPLPAHEPPPVHATAPPPHPGTRVDLEALPPAAPAGARRPAIAWLIAGGAFVVLLGVGAILLLASLGSGGGTDPRPTAAPPAPSGASPSPTVRPSSTGMVDVNESDYLGMPFEEAARKLRALGLEVSRSSVNSPGDTPGTVVAVAPHGSVPVGTTVRLDVAGAHTELPTNPLPTGVVPTAPITVG